MLQPESVLSYAYLCPLFVTSNSSSLNSSDSTTASSCSLYKSFADPVLASASPIRCPCIFGRMLCIKFLLRPAWKIQSLTFLPLHPLIFIDLLWRASLFRTASLHNTHSVSSSLHVYYRRLWCDCFFVGGLVHVSVTRESSVSFITKGAYHVPFWSCLPHRDPVTCIFNIKFSLRNAVFGFD